MLTWIVHSELPANEPFCNSISWVPGAAVNVPPQLFTGGGCEAIVRPLGSVSVIPI